MLSFYDTMAGKKVAFQPRSAPKVGIYVCGPTVYDFSHLGHARAYVAFDVVVKYLRYCGFDVTYVRNFTDIDDKIIARAGQTDQEPTKLAERFIEEFHVDMDALDVAKADVEPRVSEHIPQIIALIEKLIEKRIGKAGLLRLCIRRKQVFGQRTGILEHGQSPVAAPAYVHDGFTVAALSVGGFFTPGRVLGPRTGYIVKINITGSEDVTLNEINEAAEIITEGADSDAQILFGAVVDPELGDHISVTVIATGFSRVPDGAQLPATQARPSAETQFEESTPARASRFLVPGGPNSEYGINQTDDYEIPAILRKQMD